MHSSRQAPSVPRTLASRSPALFEEAGKSKLLKRSRLALGVAIFLLIASAGLTEFPRLAETADLAPLSSFADPMGLAGSALADDALDARAEQLVDRIIAGSGGAKAWQATHFVSFRFAGARSHLWDRYTGRHRLEGVGRDGVSYLVLHNINDQGQGDQNAGQVWLDGSKADAEATKTYLERAYGAWVNDFYWLFVHFKLRDPGVRRAYAGVEDIDGVGYEKLRLSFGEVGLTPGDTYWLYVHPETGRVNRWSYVLQGHPEGDPPEPTVWMWLDWQRLESGLWVSTQRRQPATVRELPLSDPKVYESVPVGAFQEPSGWPIPSTPAGDEGNGGASR